MTRRVDPASDVLAHAGIVTRMLAATIDFLVVLGLTGGVFGAVAAGLFLVSPASFSWPRDLPFDTSVLGLAIAVVYLTVGWAVAGQTVGGAVLGVRVVALGRRRLGLVAFGATGGALRVRAAGPAVVGGQRQSPFCPGSAGGFGRRLRRSLTPHRDLIAARAAPR
jgi:hypothetical protein